MHGRRLFRNTLVPGLLAGWSAGVVIGALESWWVAIRADAAADYGLLWWGPVAYGVLFTPVGALVASARSTLSALRNQEWGPRVSFSFTWASILAIGVLVVGRWRHYVDFRVGVSDTPGEKLLIIALSIVCAALTWILASAIARRVTPSFLAAAGVLVIVVGSGAGIVLPLAKPSSQPGSALRGGRVPRGPDILLILADTLRADYLQAYSVQARAKTPQLDEFARQSVTFRSYCAQAPWTRPSFGSMLTSLSPSTHTATSPFSALPGEATTVVEVLRANGYYTRGFSNTNPNTSSAANFDQGFIELEDLRPSEAWMAAPWSATQLVLFRRAVAPVARRIFIGNVRHFYSPADVVTSLALNWLDEWLGGWSDRADRPPLFLMLHYMDPHAPYMNGKRRGELLGRLLISESQMSRRREAVLAAYTGDIEFMDEHLGTLFERLRTLGLFEEMVVVFTSDHGEELGEHGFWGHGFSLYEEVLAVPLIIRLPHAAGAAVVSEQTAQQLDLAPTLLALAGLEIPPQMEGEPLLRLDGEPLRHGSRSCASSTDLHGNRIDSLRTPDAKLIEATETTQERIAAVEFYDLVDDPQERENRAGSGDSREHTMRAILQDKRSAAESATLAPAHVGASPDTAALRALGYVE